MPCQAGRTAVAERRRPKTKRTPHLTLSEIACDVTTLRNIRWARCPRCDRERAAARARRASVTAVLLKYLLAISSRFSHDTFSRRRHTIRARRPARRPLGALRRTRVLDPSGEIRLALPCSRADRRQRFIGTFWQSKGRGHDTDVTRRESCVRAATTTSTRAHDRTDRTEPHTCDTTENTTTRQAQQLYFVKWPIEATAPVHVLAVASHLLLVDGLQLAAWVAHVLASS